MQELLRSTPGSTFSTIAAEELRSLFDGLSWKLAFFLLTALFAAFTVFLLSYWPACFARPLSTFLQTAAVLCLAGGSASLVFSRRAGVTIIVTSIALWTANGIARSEGWAAATSQCADVFEIPRAPAPALK
jgi:hypothetical protein